MNYDQSIRSIIAKREAAEKKHQRELKEAKETAKVEERHHKSVVAAMSKMPKPFTMADSLDDVPQTFDERYNEDREAGGATPLAEVEPSYGKCSNCGAIEVRLNNVLGFLDYSNIGESERYAYGFGCELCD